MKKGSLIKQADSVSVFQAIGTADARALRWEWPWVLKSSEDASVAQVGEQEGWAGV